MRAPPPEKLIDGKAAAARLRAHLAHRIGRLKDSYGVTPALALIRVGNDAASAIHVDSQLRACTGAGVRFTCVQLPETVATAELIDVVARLNADPAVHGVVIQFPLPRNIDPRSAVESVSVEKDIDALHVHNVGGLLVGDLLFPPCTPYAVLKLLESEGVTIEGRNVVVVDASGAIAKPMGLMLLRKGATVSILSRQYSRSLSIYGNAADILIVAASRPRLIVPSMVRTGVVIVDAGANRLADGSIIGDVEYNGVSVKASRITPVPGGVGPMTVGMMLENTVVAAERSSGGGRSVLNLSPAVRLE